MGRPPGPPTTRKELLIEDSQLQYLEAFQALAPYKPPFTAVVREAFAVFIAQQMAKAEIREQVEAHLKQTRVVKLRQIRKDQR